MSESSIVKYGLLTAGVCFVGYCAYFDYKRHADPNFKLKLAETRRKARKAAQERIAQASSSQFPDVKDPASTHKFFLDQMKKGEDCLNEGNADEAVIHFANGIIVCGQARELCQLLQGSLPPPVFMQLMEELPRAKERLAQSVVQLNPVRESATVVELDELE